MPAAARHVLTATLEDDALLRRHGQDADYPDRLRTHVDQMLDLLDRHAARATFFALGETAERFPAVVKAIADRGHEVATRGFKLRRLTDLTPAEVRADLAAA